MAISTKGKRKIIVNSTTFYWWVTADFDGEGNMMGVNICSDDAMFLIKYWAVGVKKTRYMTVKGHHFPGLEKTGAAKVESPDFLEELGSKDVTPKVIEAIIKWCFESDGKRMI